MMGSSTDSRHRVSDRQFAGLLVGGLLLIVTAGLVLAGRAAPLFAWLQRWSPVVQAIASILLTAGLVYLYYRQQATLRTQTTIMDNQERLMELEYEPHLFEIAADHWIDNDGADYRYSGTLTNSGNGLARDLYFRFELYVSAAELRDVDACRRVDRPARSGASFVSVNDVRFETDLSVTLTVDRSISPSAPFRIHDDPGPLTFTVPPLGAEPDEGTAAWELDTERLTPVSKLEDGETRSLSGTSTLRIGSPASSGGYTPDIPLDMALATLREAGFRTAYFWAGIEYLDTLGNVHCVTSRERSLELKRHYVQNPTGEWAAGDGALADLRESQPDHPDVQSERLGSRGRSTPSRP